MTVLFLIGGDELLDKSSPVEEPIPVSKCKSRKKPLSEMNPSQQMLVGAAKSLNKLVEVIACKKSKEDTMTPVLPLAFCEKNI